MDSNWRELLSGVFHRRAARPDVASFSECGPVRKENQDHVFAGRDVFCVADGMGGGEGGGKASEMVRKEISKAARGHVEFSERTRLVDEAVRRADTAVREYASSHAFSQMGSTAAVLVLDPDGGRAAVGNIGDSRVYRLRAGSLVQLTRDHTVEEELRRHGASLGASGFADMRVSAFSHMLTHAVGIGDDASLEWSEVDVASGDVFLLCSDGVYGFARNDRLQSALVCGRDADEAAERVRRLVLAGGAGDNFSAVVVKV